MANANIKISQLYNINGNLTANALIPIVSTNGVFNTDKVSVGNIANFILTEAGNTLDPVNLASLAYSVANAAQPNITSVGTLTSLSVTGSANLGYVNNINILGGNAGNVLTTYGNGTLYWGAGGGGGGGNTGNIGFNGNVIYSNLGVTIVNSDLGNVGSAGLFLPAQGGGDPTVYLDNFSGSLTIHTENGSNSYTEVYQSQYSWEVYSEDDLTGTNSAWAWVRAELPNTETPTVFIENVKGSDGIPYRWTFDQDGNLTLPGNTFSVNYANGTQVPLGGGGSIIANGLSNVSIPVANGDVVINSTSVDTNIWVNEYGDLLDTQDLEGDSCFIDVDDNVYITGTGRNPDINTNQAFLRKLSPVGSVLWEVALPPDTPSVGYYSSGEVIITDLNNFVYWLVNLWGPASNFMVLKLDPNGSIIWSTLVEGAYYGLDIASIDSGNKVIINSDGAKLTCLDSAGNWLWSLDPGTAYVTNDTGSNILIGQTNGIVSAYDYNGTKLWENQVFNGLNVWMLASDGTDWYAGTNDGYITKISGIDNSTVIWNILINDNYGFSAYWMDYYNGYLYVNSEGSDYVATGLMTVKIDSTTGNFVWARNLRGDNNIYQWYWWGHHDLSVRGNYYVTTGYGYPNNSNNSKQIIGRFPIDGSGVGSTFGGVFTYYDAQSYVYVTITSNPGEGYNGNPVQPDPVTTTIDNTLITLVSPYAFNNNLYTSELINTWDFVGDGNLYFPPTVNDYPINRQRYGMGNLAVWNDGGWTIGEYNSDTDAFGSEGIRINPGIEGPADINLPADAVNYPVSINNYAGNVRINVANGYAWDFKSDGNLILPSDFSSINYANGSPYGGGGAGASNKIYNGTSYANIADVNGNLEVNINSNSWTFDSTGNLTIPTNGTIIGNLTLPTNGTINSTIGIGNVIINTNDGTNTYTWKFSEFGNLIIPNNAGYIGSSYGTNDLLLQATSTRGLKLRGPNSSIILDNNTTSVVFNSEYIQQTANTFTMLSSYNYVINSLNPGTYPSGYYKGMNFNVSTTGGTGTGMTVNFSCPETNQSIDNISIRNPGYGYVNGDIITIGGGNASFTLAIQNGYYQLDYSGLTGSLYQGGAVELCGYQQGYITKATNTDPLLIASLQGNLQLFTQGGSNFVNYWTFDTTGNLSVPGPIKSKTTPAIGARITNVPFPSGQGAGGSCVWVGSDLSNAQTQQVVAYGDITGWIVTLNDDPGFTATVLSMNPVGYWGVETSVRMSYSAGRTLIFTSPDYTPEQYANLYLSVGADNWNFDTTGNLTLPTNGTISYTPGNSSSWNTPAPTSIQEALDRLAAVVKTLNGGTGA